MEHCSPRPPNGNITTFSILLLSLLLPIFVILCVFMYFIDSRILSLTRTSFSDEKRRNWRHNGDETSSDSDSDDNEVMASTPSTYSTDLLDGFIEDIQIQPLSPEVMAPPLDENVPPKSGWLVDDLAENVRTTTLELKRPTRVTESQHSPCDGSQPTDSKKKTIPAVVMWDGQISWALKGASIFDNIDEEYGAFGNKSNMLTRQPYADLWVFQYGLRYIPSVLDHDVYRTIRIDELPRDIKINEILPLVKGEIYEARLAITTAITRYNTAMITFVTEKDAAEFLVSPNSRRLPGKVVPVHTPTYPISADMGSLIKESGYTRCLAVFQYRQSLKQQITRVLTRAHHDFSPQLESISDGPAHGEVAIKMLSVKAAATVFDLLNGHPALSRCEFRFLTHDAVPTDPAAGLFARSSG
ncbi:hypothetical protein BJX66DRAFT_336954 [Aspergillus keveii]|uniref:Uncharacterized protein n=1 Tax=Aspergillus keveii TaxID=714993 RepID=A0ABR4G8R7_9EURO